MVTAKLTYRNGTRHFRVEVDGHAGQAELGQDLICSAVSILTYTTAQVIQSMTTVKCYFPVSPTIELQSGKAVIDAVCYTEKDYNELRYATLFVSAGFALLQNQFPDHVKFIIDEA